MPSSRLKSTTGEASNEDEIRIFNHCKLGALGNRLVLNYALPCVALQTAIVDLLKCGHLGWQGDSLRLAWQYSRCQSYPL